MCAAFNFGMKSTRFKPPGQSGKGCKDRRRLPHATRLVFYTPEEIEALARTLGDGPPPLRCFHFCELESELHEDRRDAEAVRIAAYAGLRLGELLALRWRDIDWTGAALTISRALSAGVEGATNIKAGSARADGRPGRGRIGPALSARRLCQTGRTPCSAMPWSSRLDGSATQAPFKRARDAAGPRPLRWHDLRHTFGSPPVAAGVDLVSVKDAMGHSQLSTTSRYLHARPATERGSGIHRSVQLHDPRERSSRRP